jgi:hypothetical protein
MQTLEGDLMCIIGGVYRSKTLTISEHAEKKKCLPLYTNLIHLKD